MFLKLVLELHNQKEVKVTAPLRLKEFYDSTEYRTNNIQLRYEF